MVNLQEFNKFCPFIPVFSWQLLFHHATLPCGPDQWMLLQKASRQNLPFYPAILDQRPSLKLSRFKKKFFYKNIVSSDHSSLTDCLYLFSSFEHPKHMLKLMGKKIFTLLNSTILFI